jgi:hypothetical protein
LANQNDDDSLSTELESRLDDLFGEDEKFSDRTPKDGLSQDYPLGELKNLVLSIDWEITDEVLENFLRQVDALKHTYKNDKINLTFLQILGSLGEYIKTNRGKAHPKTFKILNSVFSRFDDVVLAKDMPESEKKRILRPEMNKYKELREQISRNKTEKIAKKVAKPAQKITAQPMEPHAGKDVSSTRKTVKPEKVFMDRAPVASIGDVSYPAELAKAVAEIKKFIHTEIKALREDLIRVGRQK